MIHGLCGLPRSGTTLVGNALAQHPDVYVSGTSALPGCVEQVVNTLSASPEIQSDLATVPGTYDRTLAAIRGLCDGWYADRDEPTIVDKGRGWIMFRPLLAQLYPSSTLIVCVRDPRDVVASIERAHRRTAAFNSPIARTLYEAADVLMRPDGMVGGPIRFAEDLVRRNLPDVMWVRYESLVRDPRTVVADLYAALGLDGECDTENVENQAPDLDALYYNKYPHDAAGAIKSTGTQWSDLLDAELAAAIAGRYPFFMKTFGYDV